MQHRAPPGERTAHRAQRQAERSRFQPAAVVKPATQVWAAERQITPALVQRLVRLHWPALAQAPVVAFNEGWDNAIFRIGDEHLLRIPRRTLAIDLLRTELQLLPVVASHLSVSIPVPVLAVERDRDIGWPLMGYRLLPGTTADHHDPAPGSGAVLGACLARLHAVPASAVPFLPPDRLRRLDLPHRTQQLDTLLTAAAAEGRLPAREPWHSILDAARACIGQPTEQVCVVHGDLHVRNLLVDAAGLPSGILDWGDAHLGDPALDLAIACWLPAAERTAFAAAYGPISDGMWIRARLRAALTALWLLAWASERHDAPLIAACRRSLDLLR